MLSIHVTKKLNNQIPDNKQKKKKSLKKVNKKKAPKRTQENLDI
jgi:hypothetical protein